MLISITVTAASKLALASLSRTHSILKENGAERTLYTVAYETNDECVS